MDSPPPADVDRPSRIDRRRVLRAIGGGGSIVLAGCVDDALTSEAGECPDPGLENPVSHDDRSHGGGKLERGAVPITSDEDREADWIPNIDFDERYAILVAVGAGGNPTPLDVVGVDRTGPSRVTVYTCWTRRAPTDEYVRLTRLVTVPRDGTAPEAVTLQTAEVDEVHPGAEPEYEEVPTEYTRAHLRLESVEPLADSVSTGDPVEFRATITNDGGREGSERLRLRRRVDEDIYVTEDSRTVTVDPEMRETVSLVAETNDLEPRSYTYEVALNGETVDRIVTVESSSSENTTERGSGGD